MHTASPIIDRADFFDFLKSQIINFNSFLKSHRVIRALKFFISYSVSDILRMLNTEAPPAKAAIVYDNAFAKEAANNACSLHDILFFYFEFSVATTALIREREKIFASFQRSF